MKEKPLGQRWVCTAHGTGTTSVLGVKTVRLLQPGSMHGQEKAPSGGCFGSLHSVT